MSRTSSPLTPSAIETRRAMMQETLRRCGEGKGKKMNTKSVYYDEVTGKVVEATGRNPVSSPDLFAKRPNLMSDRSQMSERPTETAVNLLSEAAVALSDEKAFEHGEMMALHSTIAEFWATYLNTTNHDIQIKVSPEDVATMMELLKISRRLHGAKKHDHYMDAAGYAAIAFAVSK